jgi:hypothetical protein
MEVMKLVNIPRTKRRRSYKKEVITVVVIESKQVMYVATNMNLTRAANLELSNGSMVISLVPTT